MVSISRVFVGKHYIGDVVTGVIFGTILGLAAGFAARAIIKRLKR